MRSDSRSSRPYTPTIATPLATLHAVSPQGIPFNIDTLIVHQSVYSHEVAVATFHGKAPLQDMALQGDAPLHISWEPGRQQLAGEFFGYVERMEPVLPNSTLASLRPVYRLFCIGATRALSLDAPKRQYRKHSATSAIRSLCDEKRLAYAGDLHGAVFAELANSATEWQSMCAWAKSVGLVLVPRGAVVHGIDVSALTHSGAAELPVITDGDFRPSLGTPASSANSGSVLSLPTVSYGESVVTGVPRGVVGTPRSPLRLRPLNATPSSLGEAIALANGAANAVDRGLLRGKLLTSGSSAVAPGGLVMLRLKNKHSAEYNGVWRVLDVEHIVRRNGSYTMEVGLSRDAAGGDVVRVRRRAVSVVPPTVWRANRWSSKWSTL